ncbi:hypothetical protein HGI30_15320 [Paenibacillus albicereus]|uniref:Uncharacterized protein n=1 Tax=Paenibacillus albicereus TaxID=2726185 RepID=A0A6H2GZH5_9BACL|nr:hypothetical protein [Paenibacillus albicereus]QJC52802.1 hypothetical protein HGI30_15320 [Paenibacillus albicereus]
MIEDVAILELMPGRYERAYETLEANRNILNRLYSACTYGMAIWSAQKLAELRKELKAANIYVLRLGMERGTILVPYRSRSITDVLRVHPEEAERRIQALIGDYAEHVFGRRPDL